LLLLLLPARAQEWLALYDTSSYLGRLLFKNYCDSFPEFYMRPEKYKWQIIFVQIDRDSTGYPHFTKHTWGVNPKQYFYPASLVKLPIILLSLEKLNYLKNYKIDKYTCLRIGKAHHCQTCLDADSTSLEGCPTIANFIRKILLVSDNLSYNRLYEFLGQKYIHNQLRKKGYKNIYILKRFDPACTVDDNRFTNPFWFYDNKKQVLYYQPQQINPQQLYVPYSINTIVGKGFMVNDSVLNTPMDFRYSSYFPLEDALEMLQFIFFPNTIPKLKRWNITDKDRAFLIKYLCMYPRESPYNEYHNYNKYMDSYKKYFFIGGTMDSVTNKTFKIFNIVGLSYGFVSDVAYIVDMQKGIEFFLAATIYANEDEILNDGKYEYMQIALPYFARLGRILLQNEEKRPKKHLPDFSHLIEILQDSTIH
jgi:hypothetical protein